MNAAGQRRLMPWLLVVCLLLMVVWAALLAAAGRGVHWNAPASPRSLPPVHHTSHAAPPSLMHYATIWRHPLFATTRQPARAATVPKATSSTSLDDLELTGVIVAPGMHMALLSNRHGGDAVRARVGARIAGSNWVLEQLQTRSAVFVDGSRHKRLSLNTPRDATLSPDASAGVAPVQPMMPRQPKSVPEHNAAPDRTAQRARIQAIKQRIKRLRRQQAAHAGDH